MSRTEPRLYNVFAPTRGVQVYQVEARTAREAERLVEAGQGEAVWFETVWEGLPRGARLDRPSGDFRSDRERSASLSPKEADPDRDRSPDDPTEGF